MSQNGGILKRTVIFSCAFLLSFARLTSFRDPSFLRATYLLVIGTTSYTQISGRIRKAFVHQGFVHISTYIMVEVQLAHLTTVLQQCPKVLSVTVYFYVVGVRIC